MAFVNAVFAIGIVAASLVNAALMVGFQILFCVRSPSLVPGRGSLWADRCACGCLALKRPLSSLLSWLSSGDIHDTGASQKPLGSVEIPSLESSLDGLLSRFRGRRRSHGFFTVDQ